MSLKLGVNLDVSNKEYHGDKVYLSSSGVKLINKDLTRFHKEYVLGIREDKKIDAFDEGSYAHTLILEPHMVKDEYAFFDGMRKQGGEWEAFKLANSDKTILSKPQKVRIDRLYASYIKRAKQIDLIKGGFSEHTLTGEILGVKCKVRADYINIEEGYIVDVKTTAYDTDQESFKMTVSQFDYGLSAAMYKFMFDEYYKKDFKFYFLVLGKKDESCEILQASQQTLDIGLTNMRKALTLFKKCITTNVWIDTNNRLNSIDSEGSYEILEV